MRECIAARAAVAGHERASTTAPSASRSTSTVRRHSDGQVVQLNCNVSVTFVLMALRLLNGVDGQDNLANIKVECALDYLCRQREAFH